MKTYIIHYTKLKERKEFMEFQLKASGYEDKFGEVSYITECDKEHLDDKTIDFFYEKNPEAYENKIKDLWDSEEFKYRPLNLPEISCTMKHLLAMKKIASDEFSGGGMILEDDCVFDSKFVVELLNTGLFHESIANYKNHLKDVDVIFFGEGCGHNFQQIKLSSSNKVTDNIYEVTHPATNCAEAYMISSRAAKKIVKSCSPFHLVSDWEFAYQFAKHNMKVCWYYPSPVRQGSKTGMYQSELDLGQR